MEKLLFGSIAYERVSAGSGVFRPRVFTRITLDRVENIIHVHSDETKRPHSPAESGPGSS
jgi:hypothetical protein